MHAACINDVQLQLVVCESQLYQQGTILRELGNVVAVVLKRRRQLVNERDVVGLVCHT